MAPAACDTIARSFSDFGPEPSDYDAVFTGDLGIIGQKILLDLLEEQISGFLPFIRLRYPDL